MTSPLVGVGVPVYNGEKYLRQALESLVGQTYENLEITISDNASEDGTEDICREFAERDPRVRYARAERNGGAVRNFNRACELSRGEYFMWAASDDAREPTFVASCVETLERRRDAVLCCTGIRFMDSEGREVADFGRAPASRPVGATPHERALGLARAAYWYDIYGLIRRRALAETRLAQPVWGFDVVLLLELCLRGDVLLVPEQLFWYRVFPERTQDEVAARLGSGSDERAIPPSWSNLALELVRAIRLAPLPGRESLALSTRFLRELCIRNRIVRSGIGADAGHFARRALANGQVAHSLKLLGLGGLALSAAASSRLARVVGRP